MSADPKSRFDELPPDMRAGAETMSEAISNAAMLLRDAAKKAGITPPIVVATRVGHATISVVITESKVDAVVLLGATIQSIGEEMQRESEAAAGLAELIASSLCEQASGEKRTEH